jgi:hypothetical protein
MNAEKYIEKLKLKIEEFKQQKTGLSTHFAKTIVGAKIKTLKWAIRQANEASKSDKSALPIESVRQSLFNEVYDKWLELDDDEQFKSWLNSNC